jgi:hypothetical protein
MAGSANLSPGVDVIERDVSLRIPTVTSSTGAIVVASGRGPLNVRTLINTEKDYVDTFGEPDDVNYRHFFTAKAFLEGSSQLYVVRVENEDTLCSGLTIGLSGGTTVSEWATPLEAKYFPATYDNIPDTTPLALDGGVPFFGNGGTDQTAQDIARNNETFHIFGVGAGPYYDGVQVAVVNAEDYQTLLTFKSELAQAATSQETQAIIYKYYYGNAPGTTSGDPGYEVWGGVTPPPSSNPIFTDTGDYLIGSILRDELIFTPSETPTGEWDVDSGRLAEWTAFEYGPEITAEKDEFVLFVYADGTLQEKYLCSKLKDKRDGQGNKMFGPELVNGNSNYIYFFIGYSEESAAGYDIFSTGVRTLAGADTLTENLFDLVGEIELGWRTFFTNKEEIEVDILLDPDYPTILKRSLDDICKNVRKDCMALLNVPVSKMINVTNAKPVARVYTNMANYINTELNINSSYSAIYGQYFEIFDFYNEKFRWVPSTGYVGAIIARVDFQYDPWWAPAGLNRGVISGINRVALNPTKAHRDILYYNRINPIPNFVGQGVVIWGQKTLQAKPSAFDRINVRRLFLHMERSIEKLARYFLFEFNDDITRARFSGLVNGFLAEIKARRGVTDYLVVADGTNNTPDVIDRNEFVAEILVKPNRVIEFIKLIFTAVGTGTSFSEVVGKG